MASLGLNITSVPFDHLKGWSRQATDADLIPMLGADSPSSSSRSDLMDRSRLAQTLGEMNAELRNPLDDAVTEAIDGDGVLVVAGQQPGLMLGPMYTFLKAVTAVSLARDLGKRWGVPVLPAFWIAGEDHDIEEVNRFGLGGQMFVCDHDELGEGGPRPQVGDLSLAHAKDRLLQFLDANLPDTEFKSWIVDMVRQAPFDGYTSMFASLMRAVLGDVPIVMIDPMRLRALTAPVVAMALECWRDVQQAFDRGTQQLRYSGIDPPLDRVGLFHIADNTRVPCQFTNDAVVVDGQTMSYSDAATLVRQFPERFSPGAALRPIVQDAVMPVAATVAGPTEMQYLKQIDPIYDVLEIERSALRLRISATFVSARTADLARRYDLDGARIFDVLDVARQYEFDAADQPVADADGVQQLGEQLLERIRDLKQQHSGNWVDKAEQSIGYQVKRLTDRLREEHLSQVGLGRRRLERIAEQVLPGGQPQERRANLFEFLARYGPTFVEQVIDRLDPWSNEHQLVELVGAATQSREQH